MALLRKLSIEILVEKIKQVFNGSCNDFDYLKTLNWVDCLAFPPSQKSKLGYIQLEFRNMVPKEHEFDYRHNFFFFRNNLFFSNFWLQGICWLDNFPQSIFSYLSNCRRKVKNTTHYFPCIGLIMGRTFKMCKRRTLG